MWSFPREGQFFSVLKVETGRAAIAKPPPTLPIRKELAMSVRLNKAPVCLSLGRY
jgi:hypothetical protein